MQDETLLNISIRVAVPAQYKQAAHWHILQVLRFFRGEIDLFSVPQGAALDIGEASDEHVPTLEEAERQAIQRAIHLMPDATQAEMAHYLGITSKTLKNKMERHDLCD